MDRADGIIVLIVFCAAVLLIIFCVYLGYSMHKTNRNSKGSEPEDNVNTPKEPTTPVGAVNRSKEIDYAIEHQLWICRYCETMNPMPTGVANQRNFTCGKPNPLQTESTQLTGSLIKKKSRIGLLRCAACGKHQ